MASMFMIALLCTLCCFQCSIAQVDPIFPVIPPSRSLEGNDTSANLTSTSTNETNDISVGTIEITEVNVLQLYVVPVTKKLRSFGHLPGCPNDEIHFVKTSDFDSSLKRHVFRTTFAASTDECANLCRTHFFCRSAGYQPSSNRCLLSYKRSVASCEGEERSPVDDPLATDWVLSGAKETTDLGNEIGDGETDVWLDCDRCANETALPNANASINATDLESAIFYGISEGVGNESINANYSIANESQTNTSLTSDLFSPINASLINEDQLSNLSQYIDGLAGNHSQANETTAGNQTSIFDVVSSILNVFYGEQGGNASGNANETLAPSSYLNHTADFVNATGLNSTLENEPDVLNATVASFSDGSGENDTLNNSTVGQPELDNSTLDSSALDNSTLDSSALDNSTLDSSALDNSTLDSSALDNSTLDSSALDNSTSSIYSLENSTFESTTLEYDASGDSSSDNPSSDSSSLDGSDIQTATSYYETTNDGESAETDAVDNLSTSHYDYDINLLVNSTEDNSASDNSTIDSISILVSDASGLNSSENVENNATASLSNNTLISANSSSENDTNVEPASLETDENFEFGYGAIGSTESGANSNVTVEGNYTASNESSTPANNTGIDRNETSIGYQSINSNTLYIPAYIKGINDQGDESTSEAPTSEDSTNSVPETTRGAKIYTRRPYNTHVGIYGNFSSQASAYNGKDDDI